MTTSFDANSFSLPPCKPDEDNILTLEVPEGLSLVSLRTTGIGRQLMDQNNWYDSYEWANTPARRGKYRLRVPVRGSNKKTFDQQTSTLFPPAQVGSAVLIAAALLCIAQSGHRDPLRGGQIRCAEQSPNGNRVQLYWYRGLLCVDDDWVDNESRSVWLGASEFLGPCPSIP